MRNDINNHVLRCQVCQFRKGTIKKRAPMLIRQLPKPRDHIMADFIADERLPLVTFISGRGGHHDEADAQRLKAPTPGIYLYDIVKKKVVSRLGDKDDNYQEARKKADYLVSEERVEKLQAQYAQLNNLQGQEQLEQYALLFTALSNGNTTYVTAINSLLTL